MKRNPAKVPGDLIIVKKRDVIANSVAFSIAISALCKARGGDDDQKWMDAIIDQSRTVAANYTDAEVEEFFKGAQRMANRRCGI